MGSSPPPARSHWKALDLEKRNPNIGERKGDIPADGRSCAAILGKDGSRWRQSPGGAGWLAAGLTPAGVGKAGKTSAATNHPEDRMGHDVTIPFESLERNRDSDLVNHVFPNGDLKKWSLTPRCLSTLRAESDARRR